MGTPSWLYYLFGLLMLAVAAYCLASTGPLGDGAPPFRAGHRHRPHPHGGVDGWDVRLQMGLRAERRVGAHFRRTPDLVCRPERQVGPAIRTAQAARGDPRGDELRHAPDVPVSRGGDLEGIGDVDVDGNRRGEARPWRRLHPGGMFFGSAVFTLANPVKGVSHHGSHAFAYATSVAVGATASGDSGSGILSVIPPRRRRWKRLSPPLGSKTRVTWSCVSPWASC